MISVVVPVFNEGSNIDYVITETISVLKKIGNKYEIIFVDDGSTDESFKILIDRAGKNTSIKVISFSRNFGQQAAYTAGMRHSSGDTIILMDGDQQDPPSLIPSFIEKINEGYDVAYAVRLNREGNLLKKLSYFCFYRVLKILTPYDIPLDSGDFGAITRRVANHLNSMPEKNRFLRGLRSYVGFRQAAVPYKRKNRILGEPKYNFVKLLGLASDGIFGFSLLPLRLATISGFFVSFLAILYGIKVIAWRLTGDDELPGWATLATALTFLGGLNLLFLGIIGEYIGRIFAQVNSRPEYIVSDKVNLD